jgi:hypothetical protein
MEVGVLDSDDLALPIDNDGVTPKLPSARSPLEQGSTIPIAWKPTKAEPIPVTQCTGTTRNGPRAGQRCGKWAVRGTTVCRSHGAQLPIVRESAAEIVEQAKLRLVGLADEAVDALEELVASGTQDGIRLQAAKEILDRSGVVKGAEITVQVEERQSAADVIAEKLKMMAGRMASDEAKRQAAEDRVEDLGEIVDEPDAD